MSVKSLEAKYTKHFKEEGVIMLSNVAESYSWELMIEFSIMTLEEWEVLSVVLMVRRQKSN